DCVMRAHAHYHGIQKWADGRFRGTSLYKLGLLVDIGHGGEPCPSFQPKTLKIITTEGFGDVALLRSATSSPASTLLPTLADQTEVLRIPHLQQS
ncbi:hypothetical protein B0H14DRAFT_2973909, partial [Mycena olivaceomarginata]